MEECDNPYAPPANAAWRLEETSNLWRKGKLLVATRKSPFPPRCVKCNSHVENPIGNVRLYWRPLLGLGFQRSAVIRPHVCLRHRARRWSVILMGWILFLVGAYMVVQHLKGYGNALFGAMGITCAVFGMIVGKWLSALLKPVGIDNSLIKLKGCGKSFLDALPEFRE